jgi:hypothetical protein
MEITDYIIIILLLSCLSMWFSTLISKCPPIPILPPQIIYKYRPELDLQFDERNFPSKIYNNVFNDDNLYIGGYKFSSKNKPMV